jgi:hypothetical protein
MVASDSVGRAGVSYLGSISLPRLAEPDCKEPVLVRFACGTGCSQMYTEVGMTEFGLQDVVAVERLIAVSQELQDAFNRTNLRYGIHYGQR